MLLVGLLALGVEPGATQSSPGLAALTVPDDRLPPSCRLNPVEPMAPIGARRGAMVIARNSEPNPLISRERRVVEETRRLVDGAPPEPDGPPLTPRGAARWASRWAEDVVAAYRATYRQTDGSLITVFAIQFSDERLAPPEAPVGTRSAARGTNSRIVLGPSVVLISAGASSDCFRAIENYVRSVR